MTCSAAESMFFMNFPVYIEIEISDEHERSNDQDGDHPGAVLEEAFKRVSMA